MPSASAEIARLERLCRIERTTFEGCTTTWRVFGNGPPLLLLHGGYGGWTHWLRNIEPLARDYQLFLPDVPGHGDSELPSAQWDGESLAAALASGLCGLTAPTTEIRGAGFSMGGLLLGHVAAQLGERCRHAVFLGPNGMLLPAPKLPKLRSLRALGDTPTLAAQRAVHRHNLGVLMFSGPDVVDELAVEIQMQNLRRARLNTEHLPRSDVLLRALPDVRAEISCIWGELDVFTGEFLEARKACFTQFQANLDFRVIGGAGHWVMYERPADVNAALIELLAR